MLCERFEEKYAAWKTNIPHAANSIIWAQFVTVATLMYLKGATHDYSWLLRLSRRLNITPVSVVCCMSPPLSLQKTRYKKGTYGGNEVKRSYLLTTIHQAAWKQRPEVMFFFKPFSAAVKGNFVVTFKWLQSVLHKGSSKKKSGKTFYVYFI